MKSLVLKSLLVVSLVAVCCAFAWAKGEDSLNVNDPNLVKEADPTVAEGRSPAAPCLICEYLKSLQVRLGDDTGSAQAIKEAEAGNGTGNVTNGNQ